ncbi:hypothetical protein [Lactococcus petauri]|uniref:hypothetical protein n=1 Tax=Lactococcus petauri TaxID=1940789 RepID=UPI002550650B|nr:hypothetical protein [Lactococcus petauri]
MDHIITNELVKLNFNQVNGFVFGLFMFVTLVFLMSITGLVSEIYMQDYYDIVKTAFVSVIFGAIVIFLGVNLFTPLSLTQKTEIKTEKLNIVRVEDKLSDTDELKLLLKNNDGKIFTRNLNINDKNTIVKMSSKDESYTEKVTQITYSTKQKINAVFKNVPKNETKKEVTVYLRDSQID